MMVNRDDESKNNNNSLLLSMIPQIHYRAKTMSPTLNLLILASRERSPLYNGCRTLCGTPGYMAPEILERFPAYGTKCDLWSTGVVLFVLLGGYLPFDGDTEDEIFDRTRNAQFEFYPDYWNPGCPVSAKNLIVRMLTINPTNRISASQALGHEMDEQC